MFEPVPLMLPNSPHRIDLRSPQSNSPPIFHPQPVPFSQSPFDCPTPVPPCTQSLLHTMPASSSTVATVSSSDPPSPNSPHLRPAHSVSTKHRPKFPKKHSSSTNGKHKSVQISLEVKVERAKGFHAFFVPLARGVPPAPPSSPVFGQSSNREHKGDSANGIEWLNQEGKTCEERWVEDITHRMDVD